MKRARPKQHLRRLKSGKKIKVNKGVKRIIKRKRYDHEKAKSVAPYMDQDVLEMELDFAKNNLRKKQIKELIKINKESFQKRRRLNSNKIKRVTIPTSVMNKLREDEDFVKKQNKLRSKYGFKNL